MIRVSGLAGIRCALEGVIAAPSVAGNNIFRDSLFQADVFSTTATNSFSARSHWFSRNRIIVARTMLFSAAASTLIGEVDAKESVHSKYRPND